MKQINDKLTAIETKLDYLTKIVEHLVESTPATGRSEEAAAAMTKMTGTLKEVGQMFDGIKTGEGPVQDQAAGLIKSMVDQATSIATAVSDQGEKK